MNSLSGLRRCEMRSVAIVRKRQALAIFSEPWSYEEPARVPFEPSCTVGTLTGRTLERVRTKPSGVYASVRSLLKDCWPKEDLAYEQQRGATYKRLAAVAHLWGMTKKECIGWYRVAASISLSDRHAGHIFFRLKRRAV